MFQGATQLNLDSKGRLAIPVRYRDFLLAHCAGALVLTADADGCLLLYPQPEWQQIREKLLSLSALNPQIRALQRLLIGYAESVQIDGAGRLLISPTLRSFATLDKQVMLVGLGNKFELWDEDKWYSQQKVGLQWMVGGMPAELTGFAL
jgi:MraZ protein